MAEQMSTELNTRNITNPALKKPFIISTINDNIVADEYLLQNNDEFKTIEIFSQAIFNPENIVDRHNYKNDNQQYRDVTYNFKRNNGKTLCAKLVQPKQSDSEWILIQFMPKKKKKKKSKNANKTPNSIPLSYDPIKTNKAKGYIYIPLTITKEIIPKAAHGYSDRKSVDIYSHLNKIVGLQKTDVIIKGNIWIIFAGFRNQTGDALYCVIDKINPNIAQNKKYEWRMREQLFTAVDICNLIKIQHHQLPLFVIDDVVKNEIPNTTNTMTSLMVNNMENIFSDAKPWQKTMTFLAVYNKTRNKREKKLTIRKEDFLQACVNAIRNDIIKVIPILIFTNKNKSGYSIHGLWRVRIDPELDIGISFTLKPGTKTVILIPTGIHISVEDMKVNCELVCDAKMINDFFDGWVSSYNNFKIGDPNADNVKYFQKSKECEKLRQEQKESEQITNELKSKQEELSKKNDRLEESNEQLKRQLRIEKQKNQKKALNPNAQPFNQSVLVTVLENSEL